MKLKTILAIIICGFFAASSQASDVLAQLNALDKVTAQETTKPEDKKGGLKRFLISIEQPTDHSDSKSASFKQKLVLFHRDFNEPMVLQTSGYNILDSPLKTFM